jgi:hypothetical protein
MLACITFSGSGAAEFSALFDVDSGLVGFGLSP